MKKAIELLEESIKTSIRPLKLMEVLVILKSFPTTDLLKIVDYDFKDEAEEFSEDICSVGDWQENSGVEEWEDYVLDKARADHDHIYGSLVRLQDWMEINT